MHQQSGEQSLLEIPRGESMGRNGPGMGNPGEGGHVVPTDRLHLLLRLHIHTKRIGRVTAAKGNNIKEDKTAPPSLVPKHAASTSSLLFHPQIVSSPWVPGWNSLLESALFPLATSSQLH